MALAFERQRSSMVVPSRTLERSKAQNYLKKAGELYLDMLEARRSGRFNPAVISAVHCGISSSDAYTVYVGAITTYLFEATFKKLVMESAMYSLSSGPIPLWLPKKNDCRMIIWEFGRSPTILWSMFFIAGCSAMLPAIMGRVSISFLSK